MCTVERLFPRTVVPAAARYIPADRITEIHSDPLLGNLICNNE